MTMTEEEKKLIRSGAKRMAWLLAIWKDGKQVVGIKEIKLTRYWDDIEIGLLDEFLFETWPRLYGPDA